MVCYQCSISFGDVNVRMKLARSYARALRGLKPKRVPSAKAYRRRRYSAAALRRFLMMSMISAAAVGMWVPGP